MEPTQAPMKVFVGDFEVVEVGLNTITINLGKHVFATIHLQGVEHQVKPGETLPFFTELSYAQLSRSPIQ